MRKLIGTIVFIVLLVNAQAQQTVGGEWSIGPRFGGSSGISLKNHSHSNRSALEFIAANSFDKKVEGFTVTALYEKLAPLTGNGQVSAVFGAGINLNFRHDTKFGASGIIGFDWRLKNVPLALQVDWLPTWFFINESYFSGVNGAFTIRYILNNKRH